MLGLPPSTEYNKRIPKQKFYDKLSITPALKKIFTEQIRVIYWRNKIAAATVNLAAGEKVTELEIFEIQLNQPALDEAVLRQIDQTIPYHIVFLLSYLEQYQAWIGYKEANAGKTAFKVTAYYHTRWLPVEELPIRLEGLNLDAVYENIIRQIAGNQLTDQTAGNLKDAIANEARKQQLQKRIHTLQNKIRQEKQ